MKNDCVRTVQMPDQQETSPDHVPDELESTLESFMGEMDAGGTD